MFNNRPLVTVTLFLDHLQKCFKAKKTLQSTFKAPGLYPGCFSNCILQFATLKSQPVCLLVLVQTTEVMSRVLALLTLGWTRAGCSSSFPAVPTGPLRIPQPAPQWHRAVPPNSQVSPPGDQSGRHMGTH